MRQARHGRVWIGVVRRGTVGEAGMAGRGSDWTGEAGAVWRGGVRYVLVWQAKQAGHVGDGLGRVRQAVVGRGRQGIFGG